MKLIRNTSTDDGTFGTLYTDDGTKLCVTCEQPWKNNELQHSCIPTGIYHCSPHNSPKFPDTWEVGNVPNRQAILIHAGNTMKDTHGCILVGEYMGVVSGLPAVLNSKKTLAMLKTVLPETFTLVIS